MSVEVNSEEARAGLALLRDFLSSIRMAGRWRETAAKGLLELAINNDFLIYTTAWTAARSNIVEVWLAFREGLASWLGEFVGKYAINAPLRGLPIDYVARASLLTLLTLARDLAEVHYYSLAGEVRDIINSPIGGGLTLHDAARFVYPAMLLRHSDEGVGHAVAVVKGAPVEVPVSIYLAGAVGGALAEDVIGRLMIGRRRAFGVTGLGAAWSKLSMYVARYSATVSFYETVITSLAAISRVHQELLLGGVNDALNRPLEYVNHMLSVYNEYGSQYRPYFPRLYESAYTAIDALADLAATTLTLISLKAALGSEGLTTLLGKYRFLAAPTNELVKNAVEVLLTNRSG